MIVVLHMNESVLLHYTSFSNRYSFRDVEYIDNCFTSYFMDFQKPLQITCKLIYNVNYLYIFKTKRMNTNQCTLWIN